MQRIILHIGRQKTGTTAIQRFLRKNSILLKEHNIYYPEFGIRGFGHHELGAPITRKNLENSARSASEIIDELRKGLLDEIQNSDSVIVISSESFQNCDPGVVGQLFSGFQVEVVVYLREQVGYLVSAYAQKIQATDYTESFEAFCTASLYSNYQLFLEDWDNEFESRITVKNYDRAELREGDVVVDFCNSILNLPIEVIKNINSDPNPTLTRDLLEFKMHVNKNCKLTPEQSQMLFNGLAKLSMTDESGKIAAPPELINKVTKLYKKSNRRVAKKYFNRRQLFTKYSQSEIANPQTKLESRMADVRDRLVTLYPGLSSSLSDSY